MEITTIPPAPWQVRSGFIPAQELSGPARLLLCSGVTSVDAEGKPVHEGDMQAQMMQILDNLEEVLASAGYSLSDVVKFNAYTTDIDRYRSERAPMLERFKAANAHYVSTLVGVARLARPQDLLEIEVMCAK